MLIRFANADDYIAIKNIVKESFDFKALKDEFAIYLKERDILLVIKDDKEVACAIYEIRKDIFAGKKVLFVNYLCVKKEFRALGIGKALMKKIKQIGCQLGVDAIELTCADFRQNSQQFYLANDFSVKKTKVFICESFKNELMGGGSRYDGGRYDFLSQSSFGSAKSYMKIAIIGAGNIGTHFAISFASMGYEVRIYSPRYKEISKHLELVDEKGRLLKTAKIALASDDMRACLRGVDMIFITTPAQIADEICARILPFISRTSSICFACGGSGVEFIFKPCLEKGAKIYALQRVPSIARLVKYGKRLWASKPRARLFISCLGGAKNNDFLEVLGRVFDCEVIFLKDFLNISLASSNAILHTARLFVIFKGFKEGKFYDTLPLFYENWDDESSELLLALDDELGSICKALSDFDLSGVKSIKEHYESQNIKELSIKIRSIPAFKGLKTPAVFVENKGYKPDFSSRYFVADFDYGLEVLVGISQFLGLNTPKMREVLSWYKCFNIASKSFNFTTYKIKNKNTFVDFYKKYSYIY